MNMKKSVFVLFSLCLALSCDASVWPAVWIGCHAEKSGADLRVAYFRKSAQLNTVPDAHLIRVSADNRYKLFVNGVLVSLGPARSDLSNWNYETVDIAPYLRQGKNTLAAVVWNYGEKRPMAQMGTNEIALLVCADGADPVFNTDWNWQVLTGESYSSLDDFVVPGYYAADRGERFDANNYPWGWQTEQEAPGFDWKQARNLDAAADKGTRDRGGRLLVPRSIPQMEMREVSAGDINLPLTVAPHTRTSVLIDRDSLTNAYLHLTTSGGKGASVEVCYAEALFNPDMPDIWHATKPHRDETTGKVMMGVKDQFLMDGGTHRQTTTLWWRTWRYLELTVETADEALTIECLGATFTAYPLKKESHLRAGRELEQMEKIGWRTARLCANETYMDCPYYEQLQYFGDARIQAMLTLYNTRDTLLPRHAIEQGRMSMTADGLTQSRYPSGLATDDILLFAQLDRYALRLLDDARRTSVAPSIPARRSSHHRLLRGILADRQESGAYAPLVLCRLGHGFRLWRTQLRSRRQLGLSKSGVCYGTARTGRYGKGFRLRSFGKLLP